MNTPNLNLFERDPNAEGGAFFSVQEMLNDNWNILDREFGLLAGRVQTAEEELTLPGVLLYSGSYTGTGAEMSRKISTTKKPWMVIISGSDGVSLHCHRPCPATEPINSYFGTYQQVNSLTWSEDGLTIRQDFRSGGDYHDMFNESGKRYTWLAFCTG